MESVHKRPILITAILLALVAATATPPALSAAAPTVQPIESTPAALPPFVEVPPESGPGITYFDNGDYIMPIEVKPRPPGYDWAERVDRTHIQMDGTRGLTMSSGAVSTSRIDLETMGLRPNVYYTLVNRATGYEVTDIGRMTGVAIFWSVPALPGVWELFERETGVKISNFVIEDPLNPLGPQPLHHPGHGCTNKWGTCEPTKNPPWWFSADANPQPSGGQPPADAGEAPPTPQENSTRRAQGLITQQAAFSYTNDAVVKTMTCWDHTMTTGVFYSGGIAAQVAAGSSYTYSEMVCDEVSSQGNPILLRQKSEFQEDRYTDNSRAVYAIGGQNGLEYRDHFIGMPKAGATNLTTRTIQPFARTVTETNAGGAWLSGTIGAAAFGVGVGASVSANAGAQNQIRIQINPPDANEHVYLFKFASGNQGSTGIFGMVWKEY